ncbi:glucose-6-phosphate isomerase [Psychrobacillus sp. FJAT-21963]|uniref:glucose-6-phosphate isomerase n=1 Tax=Psychrobacillus sp. FJAT-21963 TaxID=1712028 RepID=UPI0006F90101|nr:glucose-6-phosphate isomerase [Psychrobacillus sp. FJAT-21963]KQL34878.1 glucose-6-phosphate isomerase [Psychrobacillus sp. FJAT-21963]
MNISINYSGDYLELLTPELENKLEAIHKGIQTKSSEGADFLGWLDWPSTLSQDFLNDIKETAERIRSHSDVLVVIGIGGSYLGSKAVIEALSTPFQKTKETEVIFAGHLVSGEYLKQLMTYLDDKDVTLNVISKSGTTSEPAIAFRFLQQYMEKRYGDKAAKRIIVTTDQEKGALLTLAVEKGYQRYVVPDSIGGRYSVLTAVGLLPIATAGFDIDQLINGAKIAEQEFAKFDTKSNRAIQYAVIRKHLYDKGYAVEILATFDEKLKYVQEWWKQLFGESEGKEGKGIYPSSVLYSTDLHSLGQYIQDGKRMLFETFLMVEKTDVDLIVLEAENDGDELNYLSGLTLHEFNAACHEATASAHLHGGVPQITITMEQIDERNLGHLLYFYMMACAYSAYLLDINPFNQPGVEGYKTNMFKILKKPGY